VSTPTAAARRTPIKYEYYSFDNMCTTVDPSRQSESLYTIQYTDEISRSVSTIVYVVHNSKRIVNSQYSSQYPGQHNTHRRVSAGVAGGGTKDATRFLSRLSRLNPALAVVSRATDDGSKLGKF
jgi:hypothetical protein